MKGKVIGLRKKPELLVPWKEDLDTHGAGDYADAIHYKEEPQEEMKQLEHALDRLLWWCRQCSLESVHLWGLSSTIVNSVLKWCNPPDVESPNPNPPPPISTDESHPHTQ